MDGSILEQKNIRNYLLSKERYEKEVSMNELKISVIDLHRAQIRAKVPRRWRDKDLIGLYFSSMNIGLTQRDIWRFMKVYFGMPLRKILSLEQNLLNMASVKAERIKERTQRKGL